jgi:hypothetical protein
VIDGQTRRQQEGSHKSYVNSQIVAVDDVVFERIIFMIIYMLFLEYALQWSFLV